MAQGVSISLMPAPDLDAILARIGQREDAPKDPNARGKKGEVGLYQIMPATARQYGIDPSLLTNPEVNRWVAKRYLSDLVREFNGNISMAVAAYNAGPGRVKSGNIPASTKAYVANVLGPTAAPSAKPSFVTQTDLQGSAGSAPSANRVLEIGKKILGTGPAPAGAEETVPIPAGAIVGAAPKAATPKTVPIPKGASLIPGYGSIKPPPVSPPSNEPLPVRAAAYLPVVGQFGGELAGAAGGAAIPGLGETGIPEMAGVSAGGAAGSAGGAYLENKIREQYGLPPVSVGTEAVIGGGTSLLGAAIPGVQRLRKAAAIARDTGITFKAALEKVTQMEAELEGTLGVGARKAKLLEQAPASQVQQAYYKAKNAGLHNLGQHYDQLLSPFYRKMTPNSAYQVFTGTAGKILEMAGKPIRQAVQDELEAEPMTVRRAHRVRTLIREMERRLPPDQRAAKEALGRIEKALTNDINAVIGQANAVHLATIDTYYADQLRRFPEPRALQKAYSEPAAAEVILKTAKGDEARATAMIREMARRGQVPALQRAVATRIWQQAAKESGSAAVRFDVLTKVVSKIDEGVFDSLYGKGARKTWLDTARALNDKEKELLANPSERAAIHNEVMRYLSGPGMIDRLARHFGNRAMFDMMIFGGGLYEGHLGAAVMGAALIHAYELGIHTPFAMKYLLKFATEKNPRLAAQAFVAFLTASMHAAGEAALPPSDAPTATAAPTGGP